MTDIAIRAENLGKQYKIGQRERHDTLRDALMARFKRSNLQPANLQPSNLQPSNLQPANVFWALKDVSFEIRRGEVVGIIGRNGAGKSTLLKILSRITEPTEGYAELRGRVGTLLEVGTGFHPELTGRENIFLSGAIMGMKKAEIERKLDEIVAFAEVDKFIDTPVKHYSSGMYVRLAFAVAAHLEPEILLVDEVLAVGDAAFQKKCLGKMGDVAKEGRTVLFVSHNMAAIGGICEKVFIIHEGEIVGAGEPAKAISKYLDLYSKTDSKGELANRADRVGDGCVRFSSFHCETSFNASTDQLVSGQPAKLVIGFKVLPGRKPKNVSVSMILYTAEGVRVSNLWNEYEKGEPFSELSATGEFACELSRVALRSGRYTVDLWCSVDGQVADWVQQAATFEVTDGDYYGSGRISTYYTGILFLDHRWSVRS